MDETLTNTIFAVVAVVGSVLAVMGSIGSLIAFVWTRFELRSQRQETKELQKLASDLEHRVHRLATHLDHRIYRLERTRDLINNLMGVSVQLRQQSREHADKLDAAVTRGMAMPELRAIVNVIGDEQLKCLFVSLAENYEHPIWPETWNEGLSPDDFLKADQLVQIQAGHIRDMHERVLLLWEEATSDERHLGSSSDVIPLPSI
jgi:hypothetical protein